MIDFPSEEMGTSGPGLTTPVPAGTWADEGAEDGESETDRLLRPAGVGSWTGGAEIVAFPKQPGTHRRSAQGADESVADDESAETNSVPPLEEAESRATEAPATEAPATDRTSEPAVSESMTSAEVSGTQATHAASRSGLEEEEDTRPKFLASELLARDWTPKAPLRRTLRWGAIVIGAVGIVGMLTLGALAPEALGLTVLFALCVATGVVPLSPATRGSALATVGTAGAVAVAYLENATSQSGGTPLLIGCITLTASGLFFRAAHNRSRLARVLVAMGLFATATWLVLTGGIDAVVVQSLDWQAWIQPASRVMLGLVALLTLLTFLDPTSHGGSWVAGFTLLAWLALDGAGGGLLTVFPLRAPALDPAQAEWAVRAALPLFATIAAGGLCQVWVTLSRMAHRPRASQPEAT